MLSFPFGDRSRYQSVTVVAYVGSHQIIDYSAYYSSLLAIYTLNTLHSHRGQFWGRAALAPVILNGSGRFYLRGKRFRRPESRRKCCGDSAGFVADEINVDFIVLVACSATRRQAALRLYARSSI